MKNRWIALLLALVLTFSMLPTAFALDTAEAFETDQKLEAEDIPFPEVLGAYTDGTEPAAEEAADDMLAVQQSAEEPLPELPELTREELVQALLQRQTREDGEAAAQLEDELEPCGNNGQYTGPGGRVSSASAFATAVGGSSYASVSGNTVKLLRNSVPKQTITMSGNFTVDLNGHQLFNDDFIGDDHFYALLISKSGTQTLIDSKFSANSNKSGFWGALCTQGGSVVAKSCYIMQTEIYNGSFTGSNISVYALGNSGNRVTVSNSVINCSYTFGGTSYLTNCYFYYDEDNHRSISVKGGNVTISGWDTLVDGYIGMYGGSLTIEEGNFGHEGIPCAFLSAGTVQINDGRFIQSLNLSSDSTAEVTIDGGEFYAEDEKDLSLVQYGGTVMINDGDWYSSTEEDPDSTSTTTVLERCLKAAGGELDITGGYFYGKLHIVGGSTIIDGGEFYDTVWVENENKLIANLTVNDGILHTEEEDVRLLCQMSGAVTINGGTWTAPVVKDKNTEAPLRQRCLDVRGGTLRITDGAIDGAVSVYGSGAKLEIIGGDFRAAAESAVYVQEATASISGGTIYGCPKVLFARDGANVTVSGGELISSGEYNVDRPDIVSPAVEVYNRAKLTLSGGSISNAYDAIFARRNTGCTINISGGTVEAKNTALDLWGGNTVRLTGGTFTAGEHTVWSPEIKNISGWIPSGYLLVGNNVPADFDTTMYPMLDAGTVKIVSAKTAVEKVTAMIDAIGDVTINSEGAIVRAETAYSALSATQKSQVRNYSTLVAARRAFNLLMEEAYVAEVEKLIDAIGEVTLNSGEAIERAERAYNSLSYDMRLEVSNRDVLFEARETYDELVSAHAIETVEALIDAIGEVTLDSGDAIEQAENAYNNLTPEQQDEVRNFDDLLAARAEFNELVTIKAVEDKIDAIGTVTRDSGAAIREAQDAYDALTAEQQARVGNYGTLLAAIEAFRDWEDIAEVEDLINAIGRVELTDESLAKIREAQDAYDELTAAQQAQVRNYNTLAAAHTTYERLVQESKKDETIREIVSQLQALPDSKSVSKDDEDFIRAANEAYTNAIDDVRTVISKSYKQLVKNLTACLKMLDKYQKAADKVNSLIDNLPFEKVEDMELSDEKSVKAAEKAYTRLSEEQQSFVDEDKANYLLYEVLLRMKELVSNKQEIQSVEKLVKKLPAAAKIKASDEDKLNEALRAVESLHDKDLRIKDDLETKLQESADAFYAGMQQSAVLREMLKKLDPDAMNREMAELYEKAQELFDGDKKLFQRFTKKEEQNVLKNCQKTLKKIQSAVKKVERLIEQLDPDNITAKTAKKVQKAWDAYRALSEANRDFVDPVLYDKLVQCHDQLMS